MIVYGYLTLSSLQKINKKNERKTDENRKITIKPKLLRSMIVRLDEGEASSSAKVVLKEDDTINMTCQISRILNP